MITVKILNALFSNLVPPAHFTCVKLFDDDGGGLVWFWVLLAVLELSKPTRLASYSQILLPLE